MMNKFSDMIDKYSIKQNRKIRNFCDPILSHFGVNHFWYYKVTHEGYYSCLGSNIHWTEFYFDQKLYIPNPYLRNPHNFQTGLSFIRQVKDDAFERTVDFGAKNYNVNQSLIFLEKTKEGIEGYGFATDMPNIVFEMLCLNELPLFKVFLRRFQEEFNPLLTKMNENMVEIASVIGPSFYIKKPLIHFPSIDKQKILKQFNLADLLTLSKREKEVLFHTSRGLVAAEISSQLGLSKRTVEHYIENIKNKLSCYSKSDLIQKANEFLSLGYSLP